MDVVKVMDCNFGMVLGRCWFYNGLVISAAFILVTQARMQVLNDGPLKVLVR